MKKITIVLTALFLLSGLQTGFAQTTPPAPDADNSVKAQAPAETTVKPAKTEKKKAKHTKTNKDKKSTKTKKVKK